MVVWIRRLRTLWLRLAASVSETRWIVLSLVLAAVGVVGLYWDVPLWVNAVLAAISLWLVILEILAHTRRERQTQFVDRSPDAFEDVKRVLIDNPRFAFVTSTAGTFVMDVVASRAVADGIAVARLAAADYVLPSEIRETGKRYQRRRVASVDTYNGRLVGLDTNLGTGNSLLDDEWRMVPARYWDHLASDIFAMKDVFISHLPQPDYGRSLFIDRRGLPRDFGDSWLLNGVGTSILALTTDHQLVLVSQSDKNESSRGMLAPSGSGSLEPVDFQGVDRAEVRIVARNGALRELYEETGIAKADVSGTAFLGFGRWLEKAAKPELLSLAVLSIDSHSVRNRQVPNADRPYTLWAETCRIVQPPECWDPAKVLDIVEARIRSRISLPLLAGLVLLVRAQREPSSPVATLVEQAFRTFRDGPRIASPVPRSP